MNERRRFSPPIAGGSSLLVIFAVLCLTIFALLSLSTVQAGGRLGDASSRAVVGYYEADAEAEAVLAELRSGRIPEGVKAEGTVYSYSCSISDTRTLEVEVNVVGDDYTVLRWQAVSVADWQPDLSIKVWDGESQEQ